MESRDGASFVDFFGVDVTEDEVAAAALGWGVKHDGESMMAKA